MPPPIRNNPPPPHFDLKALRQERFSDSFGDVVLTPEEAKKNQSIEKKTTAVFNKKTKPAV
ncbi:MAG: hypothetical protein WCF65_08625 [Parachlamydiaceae bacterium]